MKRRELIASGLALGLASRWNRAHAAGQDSVPAKDTTAKAGAPLVLGGHIGPVGHLAFSPDGRWLVSSAHSLSERLTPNGGETRLWDARTGKLERVLIPDREGQWMRWSRDGRALAVAAMRWSKDGGGGSGSVQLWDVSEDDASKWESRHTLEEADAASVSALSPDGKYLVTGIGGRVQSGAIAWDIESGEEAARLGEQSGFLASSCFAPDGKSLFTVSWLGQVNAKFEGSALQWWDTSGIAGQWELSLVNQVPERIGYAMLSPDAKSLIWVRWQDDFKSTWLVVADAKSGEVKREIKGAGWFFVPQWSPDGSLLAISHTLNATDRARSQSEVQLFDTRDWSLQARLGQSKHMISGLAFSPDGKSLALGSGERAVEIYTIAR